MMNFTNSLAPALFLACAKTMPCFTSARYVMGLPSGRLGKEAVTIVSS